MRVSHALAALTLLAAASCEETPQPVVPPPPLPPTVAPPPTDAAPPPPPAAPPPRADATLVKRKILFGNPDHLLPRVSPDGKRVAFLAPDAGVLNVWVAPADDLGAAKAITHDKTRPIRSYQWAYTSEHVLYEQDKGGDENFHVFAVDLKTGDSKDLTPMDGVRAEIFGVSQARPGEILVGTNKRDPKLHDVQLVDLKTGKMTLVLENKRGFASFDVDESLTVRFGEMTNQDGSIEVFAKGKKDDDWTSFLKVPREDSLTTELRGFDKANKTLYVVDSRGRDTGAFTSVDVASGKQKVIFEDPKADVADVLRHPKDLTVQAVASVRERKQWVVLDKAIQGDLDYLKTVNPGDVEVLSRSLDDRRWTVAFVVDDGPVRFYLYDRGGKAKKDDRKATFLFDSNKRLGEVKTLAKMQPVVIKARDGLELVSYLSLPKASDPAATGRPSAPLPMVLVVHGGPWARDSWGYNSWHQWLADRGYAVLSVNYRGSTGFGKRFVNAGDKEWAGKMHEDLLDAVDWAVAQKITTPDKVAIMGGSYGGYATLVGLTFTPDKFACGVDIVGPSSLKGLLDRIPPYWAPQVALFRQRVGDNTTPDGIRLLDSRSPLLKADQIKKPLLIAQGKNDPRVKEIESSQIVAALGAKNIPVTYVLYPDEGHGFARPENRTSFNVVAETFLAQCLGGAYEPVGDDFKGATITVPAGADRIYGLADALKSVTPAGN